MRLTLFAFLLSVSVAHGQITVPEKVEPFAPLIVGCNCVLPSPGKGQRMELDQSWSIKPVTDGAKSNLVLVPPDTVPLMGFDALVGGNPKIGSYAAVWASFGKHELSTSVVYVLLEDVEVSTPDGGTRTIAQFVSFGQQQYSKVFEVAGESPKPPPGPGPKPGPGPDIPDGEHGLTKYSYELALTVPGEYRGFASSLGQNYLDVASDLAAGKYLSIGVANDDLRSRNRGTVKGEVATNQWREKFFVPHGGRMSNLQIEGKVTDEASLSRAYKATGEGLQKVQ